MSFNTICSGCGAPSSPSVGVCPFCKTVMSSEKAKGGQNVDFFLRLYSEGKLERALALGTELYKSDPNLKQNLPFVVTFAKVLLEAEAPSSRVRSLLAEAHLLDPANQDIIDYIEISEARNSLKKGLNDTGEQALKAVLRRSPNNPHALFLLGAHFFWVDQLPVAAIPLLEACVRLAPTFLRAWGCLGSIYKSMGKPQLAQAAFLRCASLETDQSMKAYFEQQARAS